jgi:hypothetical protein
MATDGVKIIDGDLARDTYEGIMDLYDNEASIETIQREVPFAKTDLGDDTDFYHEIFVTAYALAFWEIGALTSNILDEVKRVIALQAGVKVWTEECDAKEGQKRQKELDKFLIKISQPNDKIRARKKYRQVKKLYFQPDDLLAFQLPDGNYHAMICANVTQQRGQCTYDLVATTYQAIAAPTPEKLREASLVVSIIGTSASAQTLLAQQPQVDQVWRHIGQSNVIVALPFLLVTHKDMINMKDRFQVVGKLRIKPQFKTEGGYGYFSTFAKIERIFVDLEHHMRCFQRYSVPVLLVCQG